MIDPVQALVRGPLGRAGGVAVFDGVPDPGTCAALAYEAHASYPESTRQVLEDGDGAEGRGGMPARALQTAGAGAVQDALYASPWLHAFLSAQCGQPIGPSGNRGSYSYYVEPGDHLGLHLDVDTCDVTLITVLQDDTDPRDPGGGLAVYRAPSGAAARGARGARGRDGAGQGAPGAEHRDPGRARPAPRAAARLGPAHHLGALLLRRIARSGADLQEGPEKRSA